MNVRVIDRQGKATLIEWQDAIGLHRGFVPTSHVQGEDVPFQDLQAAIPYGIPWERIVLPVITTEQFAQAFRDKGIWTEEDLQRKLSQARAALQEVMGINLAFLIDSIRRARENVEKE